MASQLTFWSSLEQILVNACGNLQKAIAKKTPIDLGTYHSIQSGADETLKQLKAVTKNFCCSSSTEEELACAPEGERLQAALDRSYGFLNALLEKAKSLSLNSSITAATPIVPPPKSPPDFEKSTASTAPSWADVCKTRRASDTALASKTSGVVRRLS